MIIKASQRAFGRELASHLLNARDNEHIELHEIRGFMADNVMDAFQEAQALSRGTRCHQYLFSVSLSPPKDEAVPVAAFEEAISRIEERLGLQDQPRVVVFHEKDGRRHAHCVFSRIDTDDMKAVPLPFFKNRLMEISKELYLEHGWTLPQGFVDKEQRNPLNFTLEQWQQAKRLNDDPKVIKLALKECWAVSDNRQSFAQALEQKGFALAKGDRRGFVAVDWRGEVYSLSRWLDVKTKALHERLDEPDKLPSVEQTQANLDQAMAQRVRQFMGDIERHHAQRFAPLLAQKSAQQSRHEQERRALAEKQDARWAQEARERQDRLNKGLRALWDRVTGKHGRIEKQNDVEAYNAHLRDRVEKDQLIHRQLEERQVLQRDLEQVHEQYGKDMQTMKDAVFSKMPEQKQVDLMREFEQRNAAFEQQNSRDMDFSL